MKSYICNYIAAIISPPNSNEERNWSSYEYAPETYSYVVSTDNPFRVRTYTDYDYRWGLPIQTTDHAGNSPLIPIALVYYATAKTLENSTGNRDLRTAGYAMQHPINSLRIGTADLPSWGYSKIASNFQVNLQNGANFSKNDGEQGNAYRHTPYLDNNTYAFNTIYNYE